MPGTSEGWSAAWVVAAGRSFLSQNYSGPVPPPPHKHAGSAWGRALVLRRQLQVAHLPTPMGTDDGQPHGV